MRFLDLIDALQQLAGNILSRKELQAHVPFFASG